ncbi:hypothetical protein P7C73_g761, partial [Tremellales sp. Uapishka_1]
MSEQAGTSSLFDSLAPSASTPAAEWTQNTLAAINSTSPSGATAQTSGFADAIGGGGLASSPNVPRPGTSINPETGKLHTAGITRVELEAKKAAALKAEEEAEAKEVEAESQNTSSVAGTTSHLEELSGREQAARQLAGLGTPPPASTASTITSTTMGPKSTIPPSELKPVGVQRLHSYGDGGEITPGLELPGAWGPVKPVGVPGSGPNSTTSIYKDFGDALNKLGQTAYANIPSPIKERIAGHESSSSSPSTTTTKLPDLAPGTTEKGPGVTGILADAKNQVTNVVLGAVHEVQETFAGSFSSTSPPGTQKRGSVSSMLSDTKAQVLGRRDSHPKFEAGRAPGTMGSDGSILDQMKGLLGGVVGTGTTAAAAVPTKSMAVAPATSLPSDEPVGALPGVHSDGVGSLPGAPGEAGVAILPDEKAINHAGGVGELPGSANETGVAILPNERNDGGDEINQPVRPGEHSPTLAKGGFPSRDGILGGGATAVGAGSLTGTTDRAPTSSSTGYSGPSLGGLNSSASSRATAPTTTFESEIVAPSVPENTSSYADSNAREPSLGFASSVSTVAASDTAPVSELPVSSAPASNAKASSSVSYGHLAPSLPSTFLGQGADHGATKLDLETSHRPSTLEQGADRVPVLDPKTDIAPSQEVAEVVEPTSASAAAATSPVDFAKSTRLSNDRTTSLASVTAISDGREGLRTSRLSEGADKKSSPLSGSGAGQPLSSVGEGQKSTTRGTGPNHTTSLTPGNAEDGVGHPSTTAAASAPSETLASIPSTESSSVVATEPATPVHTVSTPDGPMPVNREAAAQAQAQTPAKTAHDGVAKQGGHHRNGSNASSGSEKKGFFSKIKEKMKHHGELVFCSCHSG